MSPRDLRVSDAEREHVVEVLQKAIGRGMIDLDEFTERTDTALAARTRGELNAVLSDLPGLLHPDVYPSAGPVHSPDQRLELNAKYSALVRNGRWLVPPEVVVHNRYGSTKLDFSEAQISSSVVRLELDCKWGSVEVVIPDRAAIDLNAITEIKYGSLQDKTSSDGKPGNPKLVFAGRLHGGSLVIRHPRRKFFGGC